MKDRGRSRKQNRHRAKERNRRKDKSGKKRVIEDRLRLTYREVRIDVEAETQTEGWGIGREEDKILKKWKKEGKKEENKVDCKRRIVIFQKRNIR